MKTEYTCNKCLKDFSQKAKYERHTSRKTPCKPSKAVENILQSNPVINTVKDTSGSFRENSLVMNKKLNQEDRKAAGIFFTPKKARDYLFEKLDEFGVKPLNILEPSFGSGEFLEDIRIKYPSAKVIGVELNEQLYKSVKPNGHVLLNEDFLKYKSTRSEDLIVGNPPYFVINDANPECMIGRPNIYVAFLYKCLKEHLGDNKHLAFVLPTSLFNCGYYEPMRKYIADKCTILFLEELDVKYYQTLQDTMLIIIKKTPDPEHKYIFQRNNCFYISPYAKELTALVANTKSLSELGFKVKTGDVVWNQEKDKLVSNDGTTLIYNTNIVKGELVLGNIHDKKNEKKQYIKGFKKEPMNEPSILVNRGYGNAHFAFNFVFVSGFAYYAENHVNMILAKSPNAIPLFPAIMKSLSDERTTQFAKWFIGNCAMSKTELEEVLPMFSY